MKVILVFLALIFLAPNFDTVRDKVQAFVDAIDFLKGCFQTSAVEKVETTRTDGERLCDTLSGKYTLRQEYLFIENPERDGRSTATIDDNATTWNAQYCIPNKENGGFILKGKDKTEFKIEVIINGKYEQVATVRYSYDN